MAREKWANILGCLKDASTYDSLRKDRLGRKGDGVMCARNELGVCIRDDLTSTDCGLVEHLWCEIGGSTGRILLGICYRPPNTPHEDDIAFFALMRSIGEKSQKTLLFGDFNMPNINWSVPRGGTEREKEFLDATQDALFVQHVVEPTRNAALLDLVFASDDDLAVDVKVQDKLGDSDHCVITWEMQRMRRNARPTKESYNYKKADFSRLKESISEVDWEGRLQGLTVGEQWEVFKTTLIGAMEVCIPKRSKKLVSQPVWFTGKIKKLIRCKRQKWDSYRRTGNQAEYDEYQAITRSLKREIRSAKREVEERLAVNAKSNPKAFYQYASGRSQQAIGPLKDDKGGLIAHNEGMAGILNDFFASVFTSESDDLPTATKMTDACIEDIIITEDEIMSKIGKLKAGKATGPDGIPARVIKELGREVSVPLRIIFGNSISRGEVPGIGS